MKEDRRGRMLTTAARIEIVGTIVLRDRTEKVFGLGERSRAIDSGADPCCARTEF